MNPERSRSGVGSGSIGKRYRSEDPDLNQNVTDPQQWLSHLVGPAPEVGIPGGVDALRVVAPRLVHVLHVRARGTGQVAFLKERILII
jgi:hypothetical protein